MSYCHTQKGKLHYIGYVAAVGLLWSSGAAGNAPAMGVMIVAAAIIIFMTLCFAEMTVRDEADHLVIEYGPVPLFRRRLPYADMESVTEGRSMWIDGLGIHFVPWRGWTYNVWGFSCAEIHLRGASNPFRVGSNDSAALVRFLSERVTREAPAQAVGAA